MPYSPEHKEKTRQRIVECARSMFSQQGYGSVSIDEVMAEAGLTRGGFYNHFKNKEDLFAAAIESYLSCSYTDFLELDAEGEKPAASSIAQQFINAYLSRDHVESRKGLCPLVALPTDVARAGPGIKASYQKLFEGMVGIFEKSVMAATPEEARQRALSLVATCVGGMVLARAVNDEDLAESIRSAASVTAQAVLKDRAVSRNGNGFAGPAIEEDRETVSDKAEVAIA